MENLKNNMKKIFINEDITKCENRLNIALFHLLTISEIKNFVFDRLNINKDCVIYPSSNLTPLTSENTNIDKGIVGRPDYAVGLNGDVEGYIEVELGSDEEQVKRYRKTGKKVYTIYGKKSYTGANLGLDELYDECLKPLIENFNDKEQLYWSILYLMKMIDEWIIQGKCNKLNKRTSISNEMKNNIVFKTIKEKIPEKCIIEGNKSGKRGYLLINTLAEKGLSVRVYTKNGARRSISVISKNSTGNEIVFPSYGKLVEYTNVTFANDFAEILISAKLQDYKETEGESRSNKLELERLLKKGHLDKLIDCIKKHSIFD